jgi:HEAT repeat protein
MRDPATRNLRALVEHYLREWDSSGWAAAYHALIELGPFILPEIAAQFGETSDPRLRAALVQIARQLRSEEAVELFAAGLDDPAPVVWKEALDGLVSLATPAAVEVLGRALDADEGEGFAADERRGWLEEALGQARAALAAKGGAA